MNTATAPARAPLAPEPVPPEVRSMLHNLRRRAWPTLVYLTRTEVHTYAFSVAANAILSFFPFVVLLMALIRGVFHSNAMYGVVGQLLQSYLPSNQGFIVKNLDILARGQHGVELFSIFMLLFTSNGVFLPLEVALNDVWGIKKNRSYLANQLVSLGLAFGCGVLALVSIALTAGNQWLIAQLMLHQVDNFVFRLAGWGIMKVFAVLCSVSIFFLIFWLLPNGKIRARSVLPAAIVTGLLLEVAKYAYIAALPLLDFREVYGPFSVSVTLMFWAFIAGMLLLGGAFLSASEKTDADDTAARAQTTEEDEVAVGAI